MTTFVLNRSITAAQMGRCRIGEYTEPHEYEYDDNCIWCGEEALA